MRENQRQYREQRGPQAERAGWIAAELAGQGVRAIALTFVDNAGLTRVKAVPVARLGHAAAWGVGMSPVFDVFLVDDSITTSRHIGGPVGDLRLYPDLDRLTVLAAQPGWAWAPVDRLTQDGQAYPCCQRTFARRMVHRADAAGLGMRMAFEVEWFLGTPPTDGGWEPLPACHGPAYGMTRVVELSGYCDELLAALDAQGVPVDQFHPEYAPGQLELSVAATDPVAAADRLVLVRQTIQAVSRQHGYQASFAPVVVAGVVGNGAHLHFSVWSDGQTGQEAQVGQEAQARQQAAEQQAVVGNLFSGGDGPHGLTGPGESILAGLLDRLPALAAIGAPSPASHLRLVPQHWAGPYQCWGVENREAGLRLVTGSAGERAQAANAELKCIDGAANPYLVVGAVAAIAAAAHGAGLRLPPEVSEDPATLPERRQPPRLPRDVPAALAALRGDDLLPGAFGEPLLEAFCAVRQAEHELFAGAEPAAVAAATRWKY